MPHYISLTKSTDRARKGRVANPWGKALLSSTSLPAYPDSKQDYLCLGLLTEGPAGCSSALHFIVISLSVPCAFIYLDCTFSLHALALTVSWIHSVTFHGLSENIHPLANESVKHCTNDLCSVYTFVCLWTYISWQSMEGHCWVSDQYWIANLEAANFTGSVRSNFGWIVRPLVKTSNELNVLQRLHHQQVVMEENVWGKVAEVLWAGCNSYPVNSVKTLKENQSTKPKRR